MRNIALIVIDVQKGLDDPALGDRNNPQAEANMARLLAHWRACGEPLVHIRHNSTEPQSPLRPELPGNAFKDEVMPLAGEVQFSKTVNSAFIGTPLEAHLQTQGISQLVMVGLTTEHCVSTSVRMAANLGFQVTLVSDATAAFEKVGDDGVTYPASLVHAINLASLEREFCEVDTTEAVLTRMLAA
ncbi:MAG: cysteine hydrolase family protein [Pseudomonadota bacterium]